MLVERDLAWGLSPSTVRTVEFSLGPFSSLGFGFPLCKMWDYISSSRGFSCADILDSKSIFSVLLKQPLFSAICYIPGENLISPYFLIRLFHAIDRVCLLFLQIPLFSLFHSCFFACSLLIKLRFSPDNIDLYSWLPLSSVHQFWKLCLSFSAERTPLLFYFS